MKHTGQKIAQWLTLVSLVAMFGFAGIAEQMDKLSPGLVAGMFLSVLAFVFWPDGGMWSLNLIDLTMFVPAAEASGYLNNASQASAQGIQTNYYVRCPVFGTENTPIFETDQ